MSPFSKSLSLTVRRITAAVCARNHSSLTTELIENMDKKATWDRFYTETNSQDGKPKIFKNFEWFFGFDAVTEFIMPLLQTNNKSQPDALLQVLDMGCGTSAVGPSIYTRSPFPVKVTCADISPVAVRLMRENISDEKPHNLNSLLDFLELDCTKLSEHYSSNSLDLIVDKGTTDALLRSKEGREKAGLVLRQCLKVLRSSGSLLQFSDEDPDARLLWLENEAREENGRMGAEVGVRDVGELRGVSYYCYQVTPRQ